VWKYYTLRVRVYCCWTQGIETSVATDPYSLALAADGERTQIANLEVHSDQDTVPQRMFRATVVLDIVHVGV